MHSLPYNWVENDHRLFEGRDHYQLEHKEKKLKKEKKNQTTIELRRDGLRLSRLKSNFDTGNGYEISVLVL